jgi:hypothetical protein
MYRPEFPYAPGMLFETADRIGAPMRVVSFYQAWGDRDEHGFPLNACRDLAAGRLVPLITWEPWLSAFEQWRGQSVDSSLSIIAGGALDAYIAGYARDVARARAPLFVRTGHEMSNPWYSWSTSHGNSPQVYRAFFRHVREVFVREGARNAAFVWCPYQPSDTACYPGDDVVDWIGLDIFNYGTLAEDGTWMDFYIITKLLYDAVKGYGKPVLICEVGCVPNGGDRPGWYRDMFHYLGAGNFPLVKGVVLFDAHQATTPTGLPADLGFTSDTTVYSVLNKAEIAAVVRGQNLPKSDRSVQ